MYSTYSITSKKSLNFENLKLAADVNLVQVLTYVLLHFIKHK